MFRYVTFFATLCLHFERCHSEYIVEFDWLGLTELPTDIPSNVTELYMYANLLGPSIDQCMFCAYQELQLLVLSFNEISYVSPTSFDNTALHTLRIDHNPLTTVPNLLGLTTFGGIYLEANPMICNDDLLWLMDLKERGGSVEALVCAEPNSLAGKDFNTLTRDDLLNKYTREAHIAGKTT